MLQAAEQACAQWPRHTLHVERFTPKPEDPAATSRSFEVHLEMSGVTLTVPQDRSILDLVQEVGIDVLSSCREGTCGTCETPVLDGIPDHRDSVLDEDEQQANDCMMICVSRARTDRLVLDL